MDSENTKKYIKERKCPYGDIVDGRLDISNSGLTTLKDFGKHSKLIELDISGNELTSFISLEPQPKLISIIADGNPLESLIGLEKMPGLKSLSILDTQIQDRIKILASLSSDPENMKLEKLNSIEITDSEKKQAAIIRQTSAPQQLYCQPVSDDEISPGNEDPIDTEFRKLYKCENKSLYQAMTLNQANIYDLEKCGPRPILPEQPNSEQYIEAILNLESRTKILQQAVDQMNE